MHGREFAKAGGVMEMAQVWVNLPAKLKMSPPAYQDIREKQIPVVALPDGAGSIRVIAGECMKSRGPARTFTPIDVWDVTLAPKGACELRMPEGHTAIVLVRKGTVAVNGDTRVEEGCLVLLEREGESFHLQADQESAVLVLGGAPIPEPVYGHGPFVMNTRAEIEQAIADFQDGRMGRLR
jgi:hypothetical protein